jgi:hypothetical protein
MGLSAAPKRKRSIIRVSAPLVVLLLSAFCGGAFPELIHRPDLKHSPDQSAIRGLSSRIQSNGTLLLSDPATGWNQTLTLREPSEVEIRSWAQKRQTPVLEIDPALIDTVPFAGWYRYWSQVPVYNSALGPVIVGDFDKDGNPEVYGIYKDFDSGIYESRSYEVDSQGNVTPAHTYSPYVGGARVITDVDRDSLREIMFWYGGVFTDFEQSSGTALPTRQKFTHNQYQGGEDPGLTGCNVGLLDQDNAVDILYKGSETDTTLHTPISKEYVCEFSRDSNNFERVWSNKFVAGNQHGIAGFAVDDFDRDGFKEFSVSEALNGSVFIAKNIGDDNYAQVWQDSTPLVNLYYHASGDVDGDGWPEIFVCATMSTGCWILVYEGRGENQYVPTFTFHLIAGGFFDSPTLHVGDIDGDGRQEFFVASGEYLFAFKSPSDNNYALWFLKRLGEQTGVQLYDFDHNGKQDLVVSRLLVDSLGRSRYASDIYVENGISSVKADSNLPLRPMALENYPNPFNPSTTVYYFLEESQDITLEVFDLAGRRLVTLDAGTRERGNHRVHWECGDYATGIYFCRLSAGGNSKIIKLLLLR